MINGQLIMQRTASTHSRVLLNVKVLELCSMAKFWSCAQCKSSGVVLNVKVLELCSMSKFWSCAQCQSSGVVLNVKVNTSIR